MYDRHNVSRTKLYKVYNHMISRCLNPNDKEYYAYGGRGIKICPEWYDYDVSDQIEIDKVRNFYNWSIMNGYEDDKGLTLDRINNDGPYSPENCRWVDRYTQANNKTNSTNIKFYGDQYTSPQIMNFLFDGNSDNGDWLYKRLKRHGNDIENVFSVNNTPLGPVPYIVKDKQNVPYHAVYFLNEYGEPLSESQQEYLENNPKMYPAIYETDEKGFIVNCF